MVEHKVSSRLRGFARQLRHDATNLEDRLWEDLRGRRFQNFRFRRQVPLGPYIADFVCYGRKLIIEIDGGQHSDGGEAGYDRRRDEDLRLRGFRVLRIWNSELIENREGALEAILGSASCGLMAPLIRPSATFSHRGEKAKGRRPASSRSPSVPPRARWRG